MGSCHLKEIDPITSYRKVSRFVLSHNAFLWTDVIVADLSVGISPPLLNILELPQYVNRSQDTYFLDHVIFGL